MYYSLIRDEAEVGRIFSSDAYSNSLYACLSDCQTVYRSSSQLVGTIVLYYKLEQVEIK